MTIGQYKLAPFIRQRKYFAGLIFIAEGDRQNFCAENFLIYGNSWNEQGHVDSMSEGQKISQPIVR